MRVSWATAGGYRAERIIRGPVCQWQGHWVVVHSLSPSSLPKAAHGRSHPAAAEPKQRQTFTGPRVSPVPNPPAASG